MMQIRTRQLERMVARRRVANALTGPNLMPERWRDRREVDRLVRELYNRRVPRP